jgi:predicted ATP-dependent endonuclease of OLD family
MKLEFFRVTNYRNIIDSGWISTTQITAFVGQNEAGKSNLFEALYCLNPVVEAVYNVDEDWPVDQWAGRADAEGKVVCKAQFRLDRHEIRDLWENAGIDPEAEGEGEEEEDDEFSEEEEGEKEEEGEDDDLNLPSDVTLVLWRAYG